jgi:hypothetical protein
MVCRLPTSPAPTSTPHPRRLHPHPYQQHRGAQLRPHRVGPARGAHGAGHHAHQGVRGPWAPPPLRRPWVAPPRLRPGRPWSRRPAWVELPRASPGRPQLGALGRPPSSCASMPAAEAQPSPNPGARPSPCKLLPRPRSPAPLPPCARPQLPADRRRAVQAPGGLGAGPGVRGRLSCRAPPMPEVSAPEPAQQGRLLRPRPRAAQLPPPRTMQPRTRSPAQTRACTNHTRPTVRCQVRAHVEAQINLVAQGQARREAVVAHTLEQFK